MDALYLKHLSRRLIEACGGLEKAAANCRLTHQRLQSCQSENNLTDFLPIDVIVALEAAAKQAIITGPAAQARPPKPPAGTPLEDGVALSLASAHVLGWVREVGAPESTNERLQLHRLLDEVEDLVHGFRQIGGEA